MEIEKSSVHSFLIRFWKEELDTEQNEVWRGHITHVPSGERRYIKDFDVIVGFITEFLEGLGGEQTG